MDGRLEPAPRELIARTWADIWGGEPIISVRGRHAVADVEGLAWTEDGEARGLVTFAVDGDEGEIVSIDAFEEGRHVGGRLIEAAEAEMRRRGGKTAWVTTTNDNLRAFGFYVRRGYRLVRVELDGVERVRAAKPDIPAVGNDGIPLRDMWELAKPLRH